MQLNNPFRKTTAIQFLGLACLAISVFSSCNKEDDDHDHSTSDTAKPVIEISSPVSMKVYNSGDTVRLFAKVSDASLHELLVRIKNDATGEEYFRYTPEVHDMNYYEVDTYWVSKVTDHTNATVIVAAEDHNSNVDSASVNIHIMP